MGWAPVRFCGPKEDKMLSQLLRSPQSGGRQSSEHDNDDRMCRDWTSTGAGGLGGREGCTDSGKTRRGFKGPQDS